MASSFSFSTIRACSRARSASSRCNCAACRRFRSRKSQKNGQARVLVTDKICNVTIPDKVFNQQRGPCSSHNADRSLTLVLCAVTLSFPSFLFLLLSPSYPSHIYCSWLLVCLSHMTASLSFHSLSPFPSFLLLLLLSPFCPYVQLLCVLPSHLFAAPNRLADYFVLLFSSSFFSCYSL